MFNVHINLVLAAPFKCKADIKGINNRWNRLNHDPFAIPHSLDAAQF